MEQIMTSNWANTEMLAAKLIDERQRSNLVKICDNLARHPELSFSAACGNAQRKAGWRLFSSSEVDLQCGHIGQTMRRCQNRSLVLVAEDTTDVNYATHKHTTGLGKLGGRKERDVSGLNIHSALAMTEEGLPLGLIGQRIWAPTSQGRKKPAYAYSIEEKESYKWIEAMHWSNACFASYKGEVLMIADREADFYEHFATKRQANIQLLVRVHHVNRKVYYQDQCMSLASLHERLPLLGKVTTTVAEKKNKHLTRQVTLLLRAASIQCPATINKKRKGPAVTLSLVSAVEEVKDAEQDEPIKWLLLTTLPFTADNAFTQVCQWITFYTYRWAIERFHYILKQGLRIERLQFDNFQRLSNALKLYSVVAWHLLELAYAAQAMPQAKVEAIADTTDIALLQSYSTKKITTIEDFILTLGKLVGFQPSKKQSLPGEKLLWQAMSIFLNMKHGFLMAKNSIHADYGTG